MLFQLDAFGVEARMSCSTCHNKNNVERGKLGKVTMFCTMKKQCVVKNTYSMSSLHVMTQGGHIYG
jgi:hypothetical protein